MLNNVWIFNGLLRNTINAVVAGPRNLLFNVETKSRQAG
jgi:hypothetical protein